MITKFLDVKVEKKEDTMTVNLEVEFSNQPKNMIDPSVKLTFINGVFKESSLLEQGQNSKHNIDEIDTYQSMVYLGHLPDDKLQEILFGCVSA